MIMRQLWVLLLMWTSGIAWAQDTGELACSNSAHFISQTNLCSSSCKPLAKIANSNIFEQVAKRSEWVNKAFEQFHGLTPPSVGNIGFLRRYMKWLYMIELRKNLWKLRSEYNLGLDWRYRSSSPHFKELYQHMAQDVVVPEAELSCVVDIAFYTALSDVAGRELFGVRMQGAVRQALLEMCEKKRSRQGLDPAQCQRSMPLLQDSFLDVIKVSYKRMKIGKETSEKIDATELPVEEADAMNTTQVDEPDTSGMTWQDVLLPLADVVLAFNGNLLKYSDDFTRYKLRSQFSMVENKISNYIQSQSKK